MTKELSRLESFNLAEEFVYQIEEANEDLTLEERIPLWEEAILKAYGIKDRKSISNLLETSQNEALKPTGVASGLDTIAPWEAYVSKFDEIY